VDPEHTQDLTNSVRWVKAITILERASKLVLLDPEEASEHTRQWTTYSTTGQTVPPGYLESPRYRATINGEEEVVISPAVILFVSVRSLLFALTAISF
jgi:hypothetical protein